MREAYHQASSHLLHLIRTRLELAQARLMRIGVQVPMPPMALGSGISILCGLLDSFLMNEAFAIQALGSGLGKVLPNLHKKMD